LLTLVGPGGIGKTRLAIEVSQSLPITERVHFIPLQPLTSPDFIVPTIAEAIGFQFYAGNDPKQQLLDYLREKSWLLLMDNFEHLLDGALLLSDIVAYAPGIRLLVTSRERLNLQEEWVLTLAGLSYPEDRASDALENYSAVQLFVQRARQTQPNFSLSNNAEAVMTICRLVGGIPLGIELAASWVRALSCEAIAEEIERSLDILETSARNVEPRHRTMRASLDQSWQSLSDTERAVFMQMSVFRGGFTWAAAKHVGGASLRTLSALVEKSLLRMDAGGRYDVHELLRQYGEEQLNTVGGSETAREAHCAYYAAFLHLKWLPLRTIRQAITLDEIEVEFENIRIAWLTMVEKHKLAQLSMSVYGLWYFSELRGRYIEALALCKQAEDALRPLAGDQEADRVIGQMLTRRAWFYVELGKLDEGRTLALEGLALLQRVGNQEDVALAFYSLCSVTAVSDDPPALKHNADHMAQIARQLGDGWLLASAHFSLANAALFANDLEEAKQLNQTGLDLAEACGDLFLRGYLRAIRGSIAERFGNHIEATQYVEQALKLLEELGQASTIADLHRELGVIAFRMGDYVLAVSRYLRSLRILSDLGGFENYLFSSLRDIAQLWSVQGRQERALELAAFILRHPRSLQVHRDEAEKIRHSLRAELPPRVFAAVQERGNRIELAALVQELIIELTQLAQQFKVEVALAGSQRPTGPLTTRELEILRLVTEGLSNRDIATRLFLSFGTVKWYLSEIYGKLGVHGRMQAVTRADDLDLLR
jgi:predicted ATPase/DNA-binding CsgD family transcriptional regulator